MNIKIPRIKLLVLTLLVFGLAGVDCEIPVGTDAYELTEEKDNQSFFGSAVFGVE